jgi:RNA 3'-terminal phosphate cyclase
MTENKPTCPIRIKLILSLLSGRTLKLKNIRRDEENPGLTGNEKNISKLKKFHSPLKAHLINT